MAVAAGLGAVAFWALDRFAPKLPPPAALVWLGPVSREQARGSALAGVPTAFVPCTGDGSPTCRQLLASWRRGGRILPTLRAELRLPPAGRIFVAAFSAGGSGVKELLEHPADRRELAGVYLADASYTTDVDERGRPRPIGAFATFAREAIASGDQLLVATASANPNPSTQRPGVVYPSAAATLAATAGAVAARWDPSAPPGIPAPVRTWRRGRVVFLDYGSRFQHGQHPTQLAPAVWSQLVAPAFEPAPRAARVATGGAPRGDGVAPVFPERRPAPAERVRIGKKCVCAVEPGDAWPVRTRVTGQLVGYWIACPFCRLPNAVLADEHAFSEGEKLSFSPGATCTRCRRAWHLEAGRFVEG